MNSETGGSLPTVEYPTSSGVWWNDGSYWIVRLASGSAWKILPHGDTEPGIPPPAGRWIKAAPYDRVHQLLSVSRRYSLQIKEFDDGRDWRIVDIGFASEAEALKAFDVLSHRYSKPLRVVAHTEVVIAAKTPGTLLEKVNRIYESGGKAWDNVPFSDLPEPPDPEAT